MTCPECGVWCEPYDTEKKCTFYGSYVQPPEYKYTEARYSCPECYHDWRTDGSELND